MNCLHIEAFLIANASGGIIWAAAFGIGGYFFGKLLLQLHHVPWSTLCRADWVRNDPVFYTRGWLLRHYDPGFPGAARGHAAASEHQGGIVDGPWARGGDCGSTSPRSQDELTQLRDAYSPLFACDDCTFVDQFIARRLRSFFFRERSGRGHSQTKGRDNREHKRRPTPARQSSTLPMRRASSPKPLAPTISAHGSAAHRLL